VTARKSVSRTRQHDGEASRSTREAMVDAPRSDDALLSRDELRKQIRSEFNQEALPQIASPPGWHYCWLSSTSPYDPIHKRIRLGYQPVPYTELLDRGMDGYESFKSNTGEFAGCVSCNEMLLFKIPQERYQMFMEEFHHNMPLEEESSLRAKAAAGQVDRHGRKLMDFDDEDEGMRALGEEPKQAPLFA